MFADWFGCFGLAMCGLDDRWRRGLLRGVLDDPADAKVVEENAEAAGVVGSKVDVLVGAEAEGNLAIAIEDGDYGLALFEGEGDLVVDVGGFDG